MFTCTEGQGGEAQRGMVTYVVWGTYVEGQASPYGLSARPPLPLLQGLVVARLCKHTPVAARQRRLGHHPRSAGPAVRPRGSFGYGLAVDPVCAWDPRCRPPRAWRLSPSPFARVSCIHVYVLEEDDAPRWTASGPHSRHVLVLPTGCGQSRARAPPPPPLPSPPHGAPELPAASHGRPPPLPGHPRPARPPPVCPPLRCLHGSLFPPAPPRPRPPLPSPPFPPASLRPRLSPAPLLRRHHRPFPCGPRYAPVIACCSVSHAAGRWGGGGAGGPPCFLLLLVVVSAARPPARPPW